MGSTTTQSSCSWSSGSVNSRRNSDATTRYATRIVARLASEAAALESARAADEQRRRLAAASAERERLASEAAALERARAADEQRRRLAAASAERERLDRERTAATWTQWCEEHHARFMRERERQQALQREAAESQERERLAMEARRREAARQFEAEYQIVLRAAELRQLQADRADAERKRVAAESHEQKRLAAEHRRRAEEEAAAARTRNMAMAGAGLAAVVAGLYAWSARSRPSFSLPRESGNDDPFSGPLAATQLSVALRNQRRDDDAEAMRAREMSAKAAEEQALWRRSLVAREEREREWKQQSLYRRLGFDHNLTPDCDRSASESDDEAASDGRRRQAALRATRAGPDSRLRAGGAEPTQTPRSSETAESRPQVSMAPVLAAPAAAGAGAAVAQPESKKAPNPYPRSAAADKEQRKRIKRSQLMNVDSILYTQATIHRRFSDRTVLVQSVVDSLIDETMRIMDVPVIRVVLHEERYYSLDNRRLYCFDQLRWHLGRDFALRVEVVEKKQEFWDKYRTKNGGTSVEFCRKKCCQ
jgi:hypothetical protein